MADKALYEQVKELESQIALMLDLGTRDPMLWSHRAVEMGLDMITGEYGIHRTNEEAQLFKSGARAVLSGQQHHMSKIKRQENRITELEQQLADSETNRQTLLNATRTVERDRDQHRHWSYRHAEKAEELARRLARADEQAAQQTETVAEKDETIAELRQQLATCRDLNERLRQRVAIAEANKDGQTEMIKDRDRLAKRITDLTTALEDERRTIFNLTKTNKMAADSFKAIDRALQDSPDIWLRDGE